MADEGLKEGGGTGAEAAPEVKAGQPEPEDLVRVATIAVDRRTGMMRIVDIHPDQRYRNVRALTDLIGAAHAHMQTRLLERMGMEMVERAAASAKGADGGQPRILPATSLRGIPSPPNGGRR